MHPLTTDYENSCSLFSNLLLYPSLIHLGRWCMQSTEFPKPKFEAVILHSLNALHLAASFVSISKTQGQSVLEFPAPTLTQLLSSLLAFHGRHVGQFLASSVPPHIPLFVHHHNRVSFKISQIIQMCHASFYGYDHTLNEIATFTHPLAFSYLIQPLLEKKDL